MQVIDGVYYAAGNNGYRIEPDTEAQNHQADYRR